MAVVSENKTIMEVWDLDRNNEIGLNPELLTIGSSKVAFLKCCNGHDVEKRIKQIIGNNGFFCVECNGIAFLSPELMKKWDFVNNEKIGLNPKFIGINSKKKAYFVCENKHSYQKTIQDEYIYGACKTCKSFGFLHPEMEIYWSEKNKKSPYEYASNGCDKAWFKCLKGLGHPDSFQNIGNKGNFNHGCPYCSGKKACVENSFGNLHPDKVNEWSEKNKKTPYEHTYGGRKKVYWKCLKGVGHPDYIQTLNQKHTGYGCPKCKLDTLGIRMSTPDEGKSLGDLFDNVVKTWSEKNTKTPFDYKPYSGEYAWFKCEKHEDYEVKISSKTLLMSGCPLCSKGKITLPNKIIYKRYAELNPELEKCINIGGEIFYADVLLTDLNTVIEFDSFHWHKGKVNEDIYKTNKLIQNGYSVIRVREKGLPPIRVDSTFYREVFTNNMNYYRYHSEKTIGAIETFLNKIDTIIDFKKYLNVEDIIKTLI